jgi:hypothetical protein
LGELVESLGDEFELPLLPQEIKKSKLIANNGATNWSLFIIINILCFQIIQDDYLKNHSGNQPA